MNTRILKKVRVAVALLFFLAFSLIFVDIRRLIPEQVINATTWLQFIPSFLKFLKVLSIGAIGFLVVIVITVLFGRVYCASICPLGIFQDVVTRISNRFRKKKKRYFRFEEPWTRVRYGLLFLTFGALAFGTILFVDLLDPYSNFGRIYTFFVKPVVIGANNLVSAGFQELKWYGVLPAVSFKPPALIVVLIQLVILVVIVWFSIRWGRLYCNTICPVGTLLGWISKASFFRIRIDKQSCTLCGLCGMVCKAQCLDLDQQKVDVSRCVSCFNCLTVCKSNSILYGLPNATEKPVEEPVYQAQPVEKVDFSKRKWIFGSIAFGLGMAGISMAQARPRTQDSTRARSGLAEGSPDQEPPKPIPKNKKPTRVPENKEFPVAPPGATSIGMYNEKCTACNLCVNACPSDVLQPAFLQYGLMGLLQPHMDYWSGYCNHECVRCLEVCPTGALMPLETETKKLTQIGMVKFIKDNCIVHTDDTDCGACSEHCPTKAVRMVPYENTKLVIPEVKEEICIGCGACEFACPTTPYKAIYVNGNPTHVLAEKPVEEALEQPDLEEDFPF